MPSLASFRRRFLRPLGVAVVTLGAVTVVTGWWLGAQTSHVPDFYSVALRQSDDDQRIARNEFHQDVQQLQNDASRLGHWKANFDESQINAWLSDQLPEKYARWIARGARDPAIAIHDGQLKAAVRYTSSRIDTVISCDMDVSMTKEPNLLAIQLSNLRAGLLPLPIEPFIRRISLEAAMGDLEIRWDLTPEGPVALVKIPHEDESYVFQPVVIESVQLTEGELSLAGRTGDTATEKYQPRGPVHQFVRYRTPTQRNLAERL
ncbi:MAG: hypothetical protein AAF670_15405 [Planctomycetota bacterium]